MKTIRELREENNLYAQTPKGSIGVDNVSVRDNINSLIAGVTGHKALTPYTALERVRKVLNNFSISIPGVMFMNGDRGNEVFEIEQFGYKFGKNNDGETVVKGQIDKDHTHDAKIGVNPVGEPMISTFDTPAFVEPQNSKKYYLYYEYKMCEDGMYDVFSEVVTEDELDELLDDYDEDQDGEDEEYVKEDKDNKKDVKKNKEEQINEVGDTKAGRRTLRDYIVKAHASGTVAAADQERLYPQRNKPSAGKRMFDAGRKGENRETGIIRAAHRLAKEGVEPINELSKKTLKSYIKKASHDVATKSAATGRHADRSNKGAEVAKQSGDYSNYNQVHKDTATANKAFSKSWKRREGIAKAVDKLEEVKEYGVEKERELAAKGNRYSAKGKKVQSPPWEGGDTSRSTPYTNPKSKAKQLARMAMRNLIKKK